MQSFTRNRLSRIAGLLTLAAFALAMPVSASEVSLTIYSSADPAGFNPQQFIAQQQQGHNPQFARQVPGFGVVRDVRTLELEQGQNTVGFTDVAQFIDPTSVTLVDLSVSADQQEDDGLRILEQQFLFDLVSPEKLLERYIDQEITIEQSMGDGSIRPVTGKLLSARQGRLVIQTASGLEMLNAGHNIKLGKLPDGLKTRPTLQWHLWSPEAGQRKVRTAYQTDGLTWRADYNIVINEDDTMADIGAWVTIMNLSGTSYPDAQLKLIAGDVQRVDSQQPRQEYRAMAMDAARPEEGFEQKAFFEYHMYTLPRATTIGQNTVQQLALFPTVQGVKVNRQLVYVAQDRNRYGRRMSQPQTNRGFATDANTKVDVFIAFENKEDNQLGIPMPAGKVRVYKMDSPATGDAVKGDGALEFIGEDVIDHTPRNADVSIRLGQAFDVTAERTQMDFNTDTGRKTMEETIRITLTNAKDAPEQVTIREGLYRWVNWEILNASDEYEKLDARTIDFEVTVPAEGSKTVEYTVRYTW